MGGIKYLDTLWVGERTVTLDYDQEFALLRHMLRVPDDFMRNNFDFHKLAPGGGKGGEVMARSKCKQWFVKQLSPGDHAALTSEGFLQQYVEHVGGHHQSPTMICRIVALFDDGTGRNFIIMNNWLPQPTAAWGHIPDTHNVEPSGEPAQAGWTYLYDLKGCRDDKLMQEHGLPVDQVHKRCWKCNWLIGECCGCPKLCCLTPERQQYQEGKLRAFTEQFHLSAEDADLLRRTMVHDVKFLQKVGMMDYSAIIGAVRLRDGVTPPIPREGDFFSRPIVTAHGGQRWVYYWGIIDFLQLWTMGKKVAHLIKCCFAPKPISTIEPVAYGEQFLTFIEQRVCGDGERQTITDGGETEPVRQGSGRRRRRSTGSPRPRPSSLQLA
eukprot:TRINITY_DN16567_c0_g1_i1.p1 TRINITY_DN16567_c0_g1~~TRINITY_DN16567_c0_g1_i1.p1  ORF type:complete len:381 (+),score=97.92 TRINITY_DN16567_c0_g1_i1:66-1208(+)